MHIFGLKLREYRTAMGLSQDALVELSGVDRNAIVKLELGTIQRTSPTNIIKLAKALRTTPAQLEYGIIELPALDENVQLLTKRITELPFSVRTKLIDDINVLIDKLSEKHVSLLHKKAE